MLQYSIRRSFTFLEHLGQHTARGLEVGVQREKIVFVMAKVPYFGTANSEERLTRPLIRKRFTSPQLSRKAVRNERSTPLRRNWWRPESSYSIRLLGSP